MVKIKKWQDLTIEDNYIFLKVMENKDLCRELLETILEVKINKIEFLEKEKVLDAALESKSVRLDVYTKDDRNVIYDIEIQTSNRKDEAGFSVLPRRLRYYQALIDLGLIKKGTGL